MRPRPTVGGPRTRGAARGAKRRSGTGGHPARSHLATGKVAVVKVAAGKPAVVKVVVGNHGKTKAAGGNPAKVKVAAARVAEDRVADAKADPSATSGATRRGVARRGGISKATKDGRTGATPRTRDGVVRHRAAVARRTPTAVASNRRSGDRASPGATTSPGERGCWSSGAVRFAETRLAATG